MAPASPTTATRPNPIRIGRREWRRRDVAIKGGITGAAHASCDAWRSVRPHELQWLCETMIRFVPQNSQNPSGASDG
jgi:hypothetical protein